MTFHPSRRAFLKGSASSAALVALANSVPQFFLSASAQAAQARGETILVVIQLSGGNDGLNTVIPYADDVYRRERKLLGVPATQVRKIDDYLGLHPSMIGFSRLLEEGRLGIVQGAGYPVPDRSHFSSMDIWQTARRDAVTKSTGVGHRATGWIGRYLDANRGLTSEVPAMHLPADAGRLPLALTGDAALAISVQSLDAFKLDDGGNEQVRRAIQQGVAARRDDADDLGCFLHLSTQSAIESSRQVQEAVRRYQTGVKYPESNLARRLKTVAQLIDAGLKTRVYYLDLDGFDTHANQAAAHAGLLGQLSEAVTAFVHDLKEHSHDRRVMLMTFSEFGRRVHENASAGTDHGTAAPMFFAGGRVKPGLLTKHPDMNNLEEGDLRFTTDFRAVYAGVLEQWLGVPGEAVLGAKFRPVPLIA
jgi:uncharacterized protein (DUF1501 family)